MQPIQGRITNYRIGIRTQASKECLVNFANIASDMHIGNFIGKKVVWTSGDSSISGTIAGFHGKNGVVKVKFKRGLPGQAIGSTVELII